MKRKNYANSLITNPLIIKKIIILFIITLITIFTFLPLIHPKDIVVNAGNNGRVKTVKSILIQKGDSLWSIAGEYITDEYSDRNEYIKEIMECNGLSSDIIHEDQYILIPYYEEL